MQLKKKIKVGPYARKFRENLEHFESYSENLQRRREIIVTLREIGTPRDLIVFNLYQVRGSLIS